MKKAVLAGVFALAMVGSLFVSEHGVGATPAAAQEVVITEGHIARLRSALRLTSEQMQHWHPVEAALRAAIRNGSRGDETSNDGANEGFVQRVKTRVRGYAVGFGAPRRRRRGGPADREPRREPEARRQERHPLPRRRFLGPPFRPRYDGLPPTGGRPFARLALDLEAAGL